ncbi:MAG: DUF4339 domain-containing protein [Planctomycetota bacterium]|nr:DUF4339 domain-containing protein [Planctomycetaceae bacterium]MDQ3333365.1 DUF4339 domain-containing protein [Planctomycetota bacterium]
MSDEQWFCKVVGQEVGPIASEDLFEMFERGQIDRTDTVRRGKTGLWRPFDEMFSERFSDDGVVATAAEPTWFFRTLGEEFGPYTLEELKEFVAQGQLSRKDKVRDGRMADWSRAKQIPGLFPSKRDADRDLLSDFSQLEDAEPEPEDVPEPVAPPVRKPVPKPRSAKPGTRRKSSRANSDEDLAAELLGSSDEPEVPRPVTRPLEPVADRTAPPPEPVRDVAPEPAVTTPPPPPRFTPPPPPPRTSSRSSGGGGGFSMPEIDFTGTPVKVVGGIAALLVVGYFVMNMGFLGSMNAGPVYDRTSVLHTEFTKVSETPASPEYQAFYTKFKAEQKELLEQIGTPDPGTQARDVKNAVLTLGSAVEAYQRSDMKKDERETYKVAADEAMSRLKQSFGR